mmetsp:Transcript_14579/g.33768  ORF Transcript_14579/g.33768 Transcript_14579/m.33768 type:complete len:226 (-) Transcript_14579:205-882(-)
MGCLAVVIVRDIGRQNAKDFRSSNSVRTPHAHGGEIRCVFKGNAKSGFSKPIKLLLLAFEARVGVTLSAAPPLAQSQFYPVPIHYSSIALVAALGVANVGNMVSVLTGLVTASSYLLLRVSAVITRTHFLFQLDNRFLFRFRFVPRPNRKRHRVLVSCTRIRTCTVRTTQTVPVAFFVTVVAQSVVGEVLPVVIVVHVFVGGEKLDFFLRIVPHGSSGKSHSRAR